jgi:ribosomal protein S21
MSERLADGAVVLVQFGNVERALVTLKKRTAGLRAELVRRSFYLSPSAKRKAKVAAARRRAMRNARRRAEARVPSMDD